MDLILLITAIVNLIYGAFGLLNSNHFAIFLKDIEEAHKQKYSKLCGFSFILMAIILGTAYYLQTTNTLIFSNAMILFGLLLIPLGITLIAHSKCKK